MSNRKKYKVRAETAVARNLILHGMSVAEASRQTGVGYNTLYAWAKKNIPNRVSTGLQKRYRARKKAHGYVAPNSSIVQLACRFDKDTFDGLLSASFKQDISASAFVNKAVSVYLRATQPNPAQIEHAVGMK